MTFIEFAAAHGLIIDHVETGRWVRTKTVDHPHKKNGAYFLDEAGDFAHVQDWANMTNVVTWFSDRANTAEGKKGLVRRMAKSREDHTRERERLHKLAADKAWAILGMCKPEQHAYLDRKGFPEARALVYRPTEHTNLLVVPMRAGNVLTGCQMIDRYGGKKFLFGQRCAGAAHVLDGGGVDVWVEGFATGLSVSAVMTAMKTRYRVHVCFSAGNMLQMAQACNRGFVIADNDASGTGESAAVETGLPYFMPPDVGTDFNDYHMTVGTFAASQALRRFMQQM